MASRIAEAYVQITPRIDKVASKLNSQLSTELASVGGVGGKALSDGVGSRFASNIKTALKVGFAAATVAVGAFAKSAITSASNFEESANAVRVSYGEAAGDIANLASTAATRLGVSSTDFNNAAVRFSAFAGKLAGDSGNVVGVLDTLTTRASDFASVYNIDVAEALRVFQSGLSGEAEPLKRFGINLLESEVKAFAYANGIGTIGKELTETEKVQARYGLLLASTAVTQGDFANTSDSLANAQRILQSSFEQLRIEAGGALAPAFASLVSTLIPITQQLGPVLKQILDALVPLIQNIANILPSLVEAFLPLIPVMADLVTVFGEIIVEIMPVAVEIITVLAEILRELAPLFLEIVRALLPLVPVILEVIKAFLPVIKLILPPLTELIKALVPIVSILVKELAKFLIPIIQFLAQVLSVVIGFVAGLIGWLSDLAKGVSRWFEGAVKNISKFFTDLPSNIGKFFADAGKWLLNAGKDIIQGLIDGVSNAAKNIGQFFADIGKKAIDGFKNIFGIKSPSKVFKGFGKDILKGLEKGLLEGENGIKSTMDKVAKWIRDKIKSGDLPKAGGKAALALVKSYRKQLLKLQKEHDEVMLKLEVAQQDLADRLDAKANLVSSIADKYGIAGLVGEDAAYEDVVKTLQDKIARSRELRELGDKLLTLGLDEGLYQQIIESGAFQFAEQIVLGGQQAVEELNVLADEASAEAIKLADRVGAVLFDEGIAFAESVVEGLENEQDRITNLLEAAAEAFGNKLTDVIALALQQQAPSRASQAEKTFKGTRPGPDIDGVKKGQIFEGPNNTWRWTGTAWKKIPELAKGGLITEPTTALIGERGPEVVVPLNKFEQWMGIDERAAKTIVYNAAPNQSIDSEAALFQAMRRAKVVAQW